MKTLFFNPLFILKSNHSFISIGSSSVLPRHIIFKLLILLYLLVLVIFINQYKLMTEVMALGSLNGIDSNQ